MFVRLTQYLFNAIGRVTGHYWHVDRCGKVEYLGKVEVVDI